MSKINGMDDDTADSDWCLSCCSNSRPTHEIHEVWDLTCDVGSEYTLTKLSHQDWCYEFRFLRNKFPGDDTVLYCRIGRKNEKWLEEDGKEWRQGDSYDKTKRGNCEQKMVGRSKLPAFRGYTLTLHVQEMNDGVNFWRMVHDCEVEVDEEDNVLDLGVYERGDNEYLVYERIIMRSASPEEPNKVAFHFVVFIILVAYGCVHYCTKWKRNECCRSCGKYLTFAPFDVCFWCRFYKANPTPKVLWEQLKAKDKERRDDINDRHTETFFESFDHFVKKGVHQNVWGNTADEDKYEEETMEMEAGYREPYPSGKPIVPSELFELETGVTVVQKKLFDKFGKTQFYPSFSAGSPAREMWNKMKIYDIGHHKVLADKVKAKKQLEAERLEAGELPMLENRPETDSPPDHSTMVEYFDGPGSEFESSKKKKKTKKMKKTKKKDKMIRSGKRISFAAEGADDNFASTKSITKRIQFGIEDNEPHRGAFRPSLAAKPARSALKSARAKDSKGGGGGVKFDTSLGNQNEESNDGSDDFDIDAIIDKAAGTAAARFGQAESEEDVREREEKERMMKQKKKLEKLDKKKKKEGGGEGGEEYARIDRAKDRRKGGIVTDFDKQKFLEASKGEEDYEAKKSERGFFGRRVMSRWTKIANNIQEGTREAYIEKITSDPKNFMAMQRLGTLLKKEADEEIVSEPVYAFQLFRCSALALQKAVETRGKAATVKDPDFPWKTLGEVHLRSWLLQGVKGDRKHLELSCEAWGYATRQEVNKNDPKVFVHHASALQFMGEYKQSGFVLGSIITNFPQYSKLSSVCMQACVVLKSLHQFKQAAAYLENVMKHGPPAPYTPIDCMFIMGRIYEEWDHDEGDEGHDQTSYKAYMRIFNALKTEEIIPSMANYEDWFGDAITWCSMAEKCAAAGHYVLASDFFMESIKRYEDVEYHSPLAILHFENAKCLCRSGKMKEAKEALKVALRIDSKNEKMFGVWKEWEEPGHVLEDQLKLPGHKFVKKLGSLIPTAVVAE